MSVKKDASGRRSVQFDVEVPGTPEEVWQAIATGSGITSWYFPTEVEERIGGAVVSHVGPVRIMDLISTTTAWDPPHRFATERHDLGPNAPPVTTEWIVEARSCGTCIVHIVHSMFADSGDWDKQFEVFQYGWGEHFRILRLYLTHFRGQRCSAMHLCGVSSDYQPEAWAAMAGPLGLARAKEGQQVCTLAEAPPLAGLVEMAGEEGYPELLLRLHEPAPGIAHLYAANLGALEYLVIHLYLYGDQASVVLARDEPLWRAWINEHFPSGGKGVESSSC